VFLASSSGAASRDAEITRPLESAPAPVQGRASWWRSIWFRRELKVAEIRRLMLRQLVAVPDEHRRGELQAKICNADHPETLWSLRQDLLQVLVDVHGEMLARRRLTDISFMFAGLLDRERHVAPTQQSREHSSG
jgi:hypothetical protein